MPSLTAWMLSRSDRANPMLVRRVRQELRNRASLGAFLLVLLVGVIAAAIASAAGGDDAGRGLFAAIASTWTALLCLQANAAVRAIANDRGAAAWDLIELTGLPPWRIVVGVVQSSLVLGLLGAAALAPFLVMSYLLRGLDLPSIIFAIVALPMAGALLGALGAAAACLGANRQSRQGVGLLAAIGLVVAWISLTAAWADSGRGLSRWLAEVLSGDAEALIALGALLNGWLAAMAVALAFGTALLTHRALDRSSGPRLVWCLVWLNGMLWFGGLLLWEALKGHVGSDLTEVLDAAAAVGVGWALLLGLFAVSEDLDITARQLQSATTGGAWRRAAMRFLGPGAVRGARCSLLLIGLSLALSVPQWPDAVAPVIAAYGLFTLALGDVVARGPLAGFCQSPVPRRICTVATLLVIGLVPPLISLFFEGDSQRLLLALSPLFGPADLFSRSYLPSTSPGGWIALAMGVMGLLWLLRRAFASSGVARITATGDDGAARA